MIAMADVRLISIGLGAALLSACATAPKPKAIVAEPIQPPLTVVASKDIYRKTTGLRVVHRSHTAKATSLKVMQGIFGAMSTGGNITAFKKEDLLGDPNEDLVDPSIKELPHALEEQLRSYALAHPAATPPAQFVIRPATWALIYTSLSDSQTPYQLHLSLDMEARAPDRDGQRQATVTQRCNPAPIELSLADWQAADYAKVKQVGADYVAQCSEEFARNFPTLFHETAAVAASD
ncbi:hypothetical protein XB05_16195 [Xanthomonas arboricola]|nr:hypothetical protein XB05_16195 [Xanthomonas arboricola]